jgi:hypothetical protein
MWRQRKSLPHDTGGPQVSSINAQIDAAVVRCKKRAAQFDKIPDILPMDKWVARDGREAALQNLLARAADNAARAEEEYELPDDEIDWGYLDDCVTDFMNIGALILSLLPTTPGADRG